MSIRLGTPKKWLAMCLTVKGGDSETLRNLYRNIRFHKSYIATVTAEIKFLVDTDGYRSKYAGSIQSYHNLMRNLGTAVENLRKDREEAKKSQPKSFRLVRFNLYHHLLHVDFSGPLSQFKGLKANALSFNRRGLRIEQFHNHMRGHIPFRVRPQLDPIFPIGAEGLPIRVAEGPTMSIHLKPGFFIQEAGRLFRERVRTYKLPGTDEPHVGIEIECYVTALDSTLGPRNSLEDSLGTTGLWRWVMCGTDTSLSQFPKPLNLDGQLYSHEGVELRILAPESALVDVVRKTCAVLRKHRAQVNKTCGLHVHFDCRPVTNRVHSEVYSRLYAALPLLMYLVPPGRRTIQGEIAQGPNHFCFYNPKPTLAESLNLSRYQAINPQALNRHKTMEVRLHHGTTNPSKILNWVALLLTFIEGPDEPVIPATLEGIVQQYGLTPKLAVYLKERLKTLNEDNPFMTPGWLYPFQLIPPSKEPTLIEAPGPSPTTSLLGSAGATLLNRPPERPPVRRSRWDAILERDPGTLWVDTLPRYLPISGGGRVIIQSPPPPDISLGSLFAQVEELITDNSWE